METPHNDQEIKSNFLLPKDTNKLFKSIVNKENLNRNLALNIKKYFLHVSLNAVNNKTQKKHNELKQFKKALKYFQSEKAENLLNNPCNRKLHDCEKKRKCYFYYNKLTNKITLCKELKIEPFEFHSIKMLKEMIEKYYIRRKSLALDYNNTILLYSKVVTPLVIGLGSFSVSETNIHLHHTLGVPIIPASSVKGALRSYIIDEYFDLDEEKASKDPLFNCIFGNSINPNKSKEAQIEHSGGIIFFDAYPVLTNSTSNGNPAKNNVLKIELDVMTPHYQDYYSGKKNPTDDLSPNPILFPVVKNGVFLFMLATNSRSNVINLYVKKLKNSQLITSYIAKNEKYEEKEIENNVEDLILDFTKDHLKLLLESEGLGAKTSLSYGLFKVIEEKRI